MFLTKSSSAAAALPPRLRRGKHLNQVGGFSECLRVQGVVHPAAFPTIGYQPGVLQDPEVKGQPRLGRIQVIGELADTALAGAEAIEDLESGFIRQGVKEPGGSGGVER